MCSGRWICDLVLNNDVLTESVKSRDFVHRGAYSLVKVVMYYVKNDCYNNIIVHVTKAPPQAQLVA